LKGLDADEMIIIKYKKKMIRPNFFTNLMNKFFILIRLLHSSTCFEHNCAHLQEDNCINTESGIVTLFGGLFSTQVMRGLCTEQSPKESDDTRCCTNTIVLLKMSIIVSKHVDEHNKCIKIKNLFIKLVKKDYYYIRMQVNKT